MSGLSLIEVLISLAISFFVIAIIFKLLIASRQVLQYQLNLLALENKCIKSTALLRAEIHRAAEIKIIKNSQIIIKYKNIAGQLIKHSYLIENDALHLIDTANRNYTLIDGVKNMVSIKNDKGVDIEMNIHVHKFEKIIYVYASIG